MVGQEAKMIQMLRKAHSHGVANYKFQDQRILCYTKIISNLRKDGFNIVKERVMLPNGRSTGVYKYILIEDRKRKWWQK